MKISYLCVHNRREFKKKKRVEFREESRRSLLRSIWKFIDPVFKRISREYLDIKLDAAFESLFISISQPFRFDSREDFNISMRILE